MQYIAPEIWEKLCDEIAKNPSFGPSLVSQLRLSVPKDVEDTTLLISVPDHFTANLLHTKFMGVLPIFFEQFEQTRGLKNFRAIIDADLFQQMYEQMQREAELAQERENAARQIRRNRELAEQNQAQRDTNPTFLKKDYTFDTFVVGESNRMAHAAALGSIEAQVRSFNPLFIYGSSGLGKTHLLHAMGNYALELHPHYRVKYVNSETFTNDFINSIAQNKGAEFQRRYREVDLLLVDDIQFLAGKNETQEAFFHTFNKLHELDRFVVISSDVQPKKLKGFEERMLSRFEWGLLADIQTPSLETRIAILQKKAEQQGVTFDPEVLHFIASQANSNVRELEGMLIRLSAFENLYGQKPTVELARSILKDSISSLSGIDPYLVLQQTAHYFHLTPEDLRGVSRSQNIVSARQIAMYLCRDMTDLSLPKIGELFGGRDHTTVLYAVKKVTTLMAENHGIYDSIQQIHTLLKQKK